MNGLESDVIASVELVAMDSKIAVLLRVFSFDFSDFFEHDLSAFCIAMRALVKGVMPKWHSWQQQNLLIIFLGSNKIY